MFTGVVFMFTGRPVMNMDYRPVEYTWWAVGEPDGRDVGENCVGMDTGRDPGRWVDKDCGRLAHFACRMDISEYQQTQQMFFSKKKLNDNSCPYL